jgi:hypothetical protein
VASGSGHLRTPADSAAPVYPLSKKEHVTTP